MKRDGDGTHIRRSPSRAEGRPCQRWENKILPSLKSTTGIVGELRLKGDGMLIRSGRTEKCNENVMGMSGIAGGREYSWREEKAFQRRGERNAPTPD